VEAVVRTLVLLALVACSVPPLNLEGKDCPCASGYMCSSSSGSGKCVRMIDAPGPPPDIHMGPSCLGTMPGMQQFMDDFGGGMLGWTTPAGMWKQMGGSFVQSSTSTADAYAVAPFGGTAMTYRITADMTGTPTAVPSPPGMGISFFQTGTSHYECIWFPPTTPGPGTLALRLVDAGAPQQPFAMTTITGQGGISMVTMEVLVDSTKMFHCCIGGGVSGSVKMADPQDSLSSGSPGLVAADMQVVFDNFFVFAN
jgi:hypothetical protein